MDNIQLRRAAQVQDMEQRTGAMEGYVPDLKRVNENVTTHMQSHAINSVRQAVKAQMPKAYTALETMVQNQNENNNLLPLFSKRGTRIMQSGADVLEFDMAGSTYAQFPIGHKEVDGFEEYSVWQKALNGLWSAMPYIFTTIVSAWLISNEVGMGMEDIENLHDIALALFADNARRDRFEQMKERDEAKAGMAGERLGDEDMEIPEHLRRLEYIRKREQERKTRYTIAGPSVLNCGNDYTTRHSRKYMLELAGSYLTTKFGPPDSARLPENPILIKIKGHSRGAVTASEGAMMIRSWVLDNYGIEYANMVQFDIIQIDPVPGEDTKYRVAKEINYRENYVEGDVTYASLGESARTTVLYSMYTEYPALFTPQIVKGVDRIILTPFKHSSGLDLADTDYNPVVNREGELSGDGHRPAFIDAQTQKVYRMGALNDLESGVYILDENYILVKIDSWINFRNIMDSIYNNMRLSDHFQKSRKDAIYRAVGYWFGVNPAENAAANEE